MGRRSRSVKDRGREKDKDKDKEKERRKDRDDKDRDREKGKERDREKEKEKEKDRDREKDKDKDRDREKEKDRDREKDKERDREKEKDRDREKEKDRDRDSHTERESWEKEKEKDAEKCRKSSSNSKGGSAASRSRSSSSSSSSSFGRRVWPLVVASGPRTFTHLPPMMELQNVGEDPQPLELSTSNPASGASGTLGGWGMPPRTASDAAPVPSPAAAVPAQKQVGRSALSTMPATPAMLGLGQSPHLQSPHMLTGAALAQQQGKTQICFNYTGGRCFRENCRFLHLGPGGRAPPQPALFTGILPQ